MQPGAGVRPVAIGRGGGDAEDLAGLLERQAGEVTQLDQLGLELILFSELGERLVESDKIFRLLRRRDLHVVDIMTHHAAAALLAVLAASVFDQDAAHGFRCGAEEMASPFPGPILAVRDETY